MKKIKIAALCLALMMAASAVSGCGKDKEEESVPSETASSSSSEPESSVSVPESSETSVESSEESSEPEVPAGPINPLTGETGFAESAVGKRPAAVMINNINAALPHRGISQADILYEVVVEGGITRMLAVFADVDAIPETGPVRSARHYYTDLVYPYNAIYVHFGGSKPGKAAIQNRGINNVDGLIYGTTAFTKDNWRAQNRGVEHSYFISGKSIRSVSEQRGYSFDGETTVPFQISQEKIEPEQKSSGVYVPFSGYTNSDFTLNPETGLYEKLRNGEPHIDENNGETLQFANVAVLVTSITSYDGGVLREVALNNGTGWFFTGGGYEEINWSKGGYKNQFTFTKKDGTPVEGNVGPSFIAIIDSSMTGSMKIH